MSWYQRANRRRDQLLVRCVLHQLERPAGVRPDAGFQYAVWNAKAAVSKGFEYELNAPLGLPGLRLATSGTYADAKLTEDYSYPDIMGDIVGKSGQQLPGSSQGQRGRHIALRPPARRKLQPVASLNDTYTTKVVTSVFAVLGIAPITLPAVNLVNASAAFSHEHWRIGLYSTNLLNKREILGQTTAGPAMTYTETANTPREIYLRGGYSF